MALNKIISDNTTIASVEPLLAKIWNLCASLRSGVEIKNNFSVAALLQAAQKKTREPILENPKNIEGLQVMVEALNQGPTLHPFGRAIARQLMIEMLAHRLRLNSLFAVHPEISQEQITAPLIILGLPRSGTTLLFNLLAQDPTHRFMPNWEAFIGQVPPKGSYTFKTDPRRKQAKWMLRFQKYLTPKIDAIHVFDPNGPEECTPILMQGFATQALTGSFNVPAYSKWIDDVDHTTTYQHHKRVLQALQWKYPGERWLLKSPDHLPAIDAILKRYPDANIVHIHRDPVKSVASWVSMNQLFRGTYYRHVDTHELGQQILTRLANDMDRYLATFEKLVSRQL